MVRRFDFNNIDFKRDSEGWLIISGDILNSSGKNYNSVVFRLVIYIKTIPIGNTTLTIRGFYNGQTKTFEKKIEELKYDAVIGQRPTCQMYLESAY